MIGAYKLLQKIGEERYGEVYMAAKKPSDRILKYGQRMCIPTNRCWREAFRIARLRKDLLSCVN